jgi:hypothetical protein
LAPIFSQPQPHLDALAGGCDGTKQARQDDGENERAIETILHFGKRTISLHLKIERMLLSLNRCFEISRNRIDPLERRQVRTLAFIARYLLLVQTSGLGDFCKTGQSLRDHRGGCRQMLHRPRFHLGQEERYLSVNADVEAVSLVALRRSLVRIPNPDRLWHGLAGRWPGLNDRLSRLPVRVLAVVGVE